MKTRCIFKVTIPKLSISETKTFEWNDSDPLERKQTQLAIQNWLDHLSEKHEFRFLDWLDYCVVDGSYHRDIWTHYGIDKGEALCFIETEGFEVRPARVSI